MSEVLRLDNVCKSFGRRPIVKNMSFSVREGEIFGFLGPNGAGKTTTIKMILGLLRPDSGAITINGHDASKEFEAAMACISGIVENPDMYGYLSGYDNLVIQARACGADVSRIDEVVRMVGMQMRIKEKFKSYSLGMKQRLGVAQALLHNPKIMILDEPTNGLDPAGIKEFRDLLRHLASETGLSVLVSSHILQEMQLMCDTVGIINNGELLQMGTLEELTHLSSASTYRYTLRPMETAVAFAQQHLADRIVGIGPDYIDLHISEEQVGQVNRQFMDNGITLFGLNAQGQSLEQIFMSITGGGNIIG